MRLPSCLRSATVEPAIFSFCTAMALSLTVLPQFVYFKKCIDLRLKEDPSYGRAETREYCLTGILHQNDTKAEHFQDKVQQASALFNQFVYLATCVSTMLTSFPIMSYADRHGRKLPFIASVAGFVFYDVFCIFLTALPFTIPLYSLIICALVCGLSGGAIVTMACAFAFVTEDSVDAKGRGMRLAILSGFINGGFLFGSILSIPMANQYALVFIVSSIMYIVAMVLGMFVLRDSQAQEGFAMRQIGEDRTESTGSWKLLRPLRDMWTTVTRPRSNRGRAKLVASILAYAFVFCTDFGLSPIAMLYAKRRPLNWPDRLFNTYSTILSISASAVGQFIPCCVRRVTPFRVAILAGVFCAVRQFTIAMADESWIMFLSSAFSIISYTVYPAYRALTGSLVGKAETGKVYAVVSSIENVAPLPSNLILSNVYFVTEPTQPNTVFYIATAVQLLTAAAMSLTFLNSKSSFAEIDKKEDEADESMEQF